MLTAKDASLLALLSASISSLIDAILALLSAILVLSSVDDLLSSDTDFLSSSISLLLPRRLLEFLKAPPVIEPPGLSCSPSRVTILKLYLYFLAISSALSILSTTRILPRRYLARFSYSKETLTRLLAIPITPFSLIHGSFSRVFLPDIALRGKNVARPSLFCLRYAISSLAVDSLSVTMFWIVPPKAVSIAVSYFLSTLTISAITPRIPGLLSFNSIILRILLP